MKKFELCFQLSDSQDYIVPELLRPEKPDFEWNSQDNLRFEYQYEFMPAGVITRFIVRTRDLNKEEIYWQYGVVLERENTEALVISEPLNRKIRIWVKGEDRKELLAIIRREIDHIHGTLNDPNIKEMLPCICNTCKQNTQPNFYEFDILKGRLKNNVREIYCDTGQQNVSIEELLGEVVTEKERKEEKRRLQEWDERPPVQVIQQQVVEQPKVEAKNGRLKKIAAIVTIIVGIGGLILGILAYMNKEDKKQTQPKTEQASVQDSSKTQPDSLKATK